MKFKLDENFGNRTVRIFQETDHDVQTVRDEGLQGAGDIQLFEQCCVEQRCLITLDLDFADPLRFNPVQCTGIAVIRLPINPSIDLLESMVRQFLSALKNMSIEHNLWIVEPGRIRIHQIAE